MIIFIPDPVEADRIDAERETASQATTGSWADTWLTASERKGLR